MAAEYKARRVRIYLNGNDVIGFQRAPYALLGWLRRERALGATLFRGLAGLGGSGQVSEDLRPEAEPPVVVEWIDTPERVERLLPKLSALLKHGLITVEDTEIAFHRGHAVRDLPVAATAGDVMSRDVVSVSPDTPLRKVVELVQGKVYRAVPVVEDGRPVGMITNRDLVQRGALVARIELLGSLPAEERRAAMESLDQEGRTARAVMTPEPVTVGAEATLTAVAELMVQRKLKRLPVVDAAGKLLGMVSRLDLLRTVAGGFAGGSQERHSGLRADVPLSRVMRRDVPVVHPDTPVSEVLQAVVSTELNEAVVLDESRRVVGIISDEQLLVRVTPAIRPGALRALMHRLPFSQTSDSDLDLERQARARKASDLMRGEVVTVREDQLVQDAVALMVATPRRTVVVVDQDGRLAGAVDRADVLRGLVSEAG